MKWVLAVMFFVWSYDEESVLTEQREIYV